MYSMGTYVRVQSFSNCHFCATFSFALNYCSDCFGFGFEMPKQEAFYKFYKIMFFLGKTETLGGISKD